MTYSASGVLLVERHGPILSVTMNRPQVLNVLDEALADALAETFSAASCDPDVRVVVLSGAGRSFMAGGDLVRFRDDLDAAPATAERLIDRFHTVMRTIKTMPQPVIAAVQGPVAGGGVGLAFACDLVVAAEGTTFLSAYTKLGTSPDGGTTWSLTRLMGARRALEFILLNEIMDASMAHRMGLVNDVVPLVDLRAAAMAKAERLTCSSPGIVAAVKTLVRSAVSEDFNTQLDAEKASFVAAASTEDFREGILAFFERRPPRFS